MPFKSKAQRRKFAQLLVDGKISDETYEEWNRSTGGKELPERLHPAAPGEGRAKTARTRAAKTARKRTTKIARKRTTKSPRRRRAAAKT